MSGLPMADIPIRDRPYQVFVSYSHQDHAQVSGLVQWLGKTCGLSVWWDNHDLAGASQIVSDIPDGIRRSKAWLLVSSKASAKSGWVREEYGFALKQRTLHSEFRLIVCQIDDAEPPDFLATTKWVSMHDGNLDIKTAAALLASLYPMGPGPAKNTRDIDVSRSWRPSEATPADTICRHLIEAGYRLVGDKMDHKVFNSQTRVAMIMTSYGE